jgi:hypothetical protein
MRQIGSGIMHIYMEMSQGKPPVQLSLKKKKGKNQELLSSEE